MWDSPISPVLIQTQRGDGSGTWIHEKLILKLAQWLSVDFELWCDERIAELLRTGKTEIAKPMSAAEIMLQQAQLLVAQEQRLNAVEDKVKQIEARAVTSPTDYYTVAGYASLHKIKVDVKKAAAYGRAATFICADNGWATGSVPDPRFGTVKTYPVEALDLAFKE